MTAFVVKTILFLRKRIAKQAFHQEHVGRGKPGFKSSYKMFFKGTKYSCLLEMTWAGHQIITQAKNKPGKMDDSSSGEAENEHGKTKTGVSSTLNGLLDKPEIDSSSGEAENEHGKTKTGVSSTLNGLLDKSEILIKQKKGIKRQQQQLSPSRSVIPKKVPEVQASQKSAFDVLFSIAKSNLPIHLEEENHPSPMLKKRVDGQEFEINKSKFRDGVSPRKSPEENSYNDGKDRDKKKCFLQKNSLESKIVIWKCYQCWAKINQSVWNNPINKLKSRKFPPKNKKSNPFQKEDFSFEPKRVANQPCHSM
jgi:hypothetical protein